MTGATPAIVALTRAGVAYRVHHYDHDPRSESFGDEAVERMVDALGIDPEQVLKTLVVAGAALPRPGLAVVVLPVPRRMSRKAVADALGVPTIDLADPARAQRATGYVLGGVSPFGQKRPIPTVVDRSVIGWPKVLCSGGRRGLEIEVASGDLIAQTGAVVADVSAVTGPGT